MGYRIIGPTDQYAEMGAEAAIAVDDLTDMDEAAVEEMLEEADESLAYIREEADGDDDGDEPEHDQIVDGDDLDNDDDDDGDDEEGDPAELDFDHEVRRSNDDGKSYAIQFPERPVEVYSTSAVWRTFRTAWKRIA